MRTKAATVFVSIALGLAPSVSFAAALSATQVSSVLALLSAFGVSQTTIAQVEKALGVANTTPAVPADPPAPQNTYLPPVGSPYFTGDMGYDISYSTTAYPAEAFGYSVIGVGGGRAFYDNARLSSQLAWAHNFATHVAPTVYMNLNAPYGKKVAGNLAGPRSCPGITASSQKVASADGEPSACEGYNYGYNAAQHAYAYARDHDVTGSFWWLDIEEANSWSEDTAVNDATIQGAIDALNTHGIRAGIYSMTYMWKNIAGTSFSPAQTIAGKAVTTPSWFPIGIKTRTEALNACHTATSFIKDSPIWIIQYVEDSTSVDQNIAC